MASATTTNWHLKGQGYEFCNCDFGCGCNFGGFPNSKDGSCRALVGLNIVQGKCGMPWEILGPTAAVVGLVKAKITIEGKGRKSTFRAEGVGEGRGDTFKNPVTGEDHLADVHLPDGFIWQNGQCGQGSFRASASGVSVAADKTNWIFYQFDWSNAKAKK